MKWCLHNTGLSFIPIRLHPGYILSIYICLHDTGSSFIPVRLHPGSIRSFKIHFPVLFILGFISFVVPDLNVYSGNEIRLHVAQCHVNEYKLILVRNWTRELVGLIA